MADFSWEECVSDALQDNADAHAATRQFLIAEGFRVPADWTQLDEWAERLVLTELRSKAGLTLVQMARVQRGLASWASGALQSEEEVRATDRRVEAEMKRLSFFRNRFPLTYLHFSRGVHIESLSPFCYTDSMIKAMLLSDWRAEDLRGSLIGYCDTNILLAGLLLSGMVGCLGIDPQDTNIDKTLIVLIAVDIVCGMVAVQTYSSLRVTLSALSESNLRAWCWGALPTFRFAGAFSCVFLYMISVIFVGFIVPRSISVVQFEAPRSTAALG